MGSMSPSRPFSFFHPDQLVRGGKHDEARDAAREERASAGATLGRALGVLHEAARGLEALLLERPLTVLAVASGVAFAAGALGGSRVVRSVATFGLGYALGWRWRDARIGLRGLRRRSKGRR